MRILGSPSEELHTYLHLELREELLVKSATHYKTSKGLLAKIQVACGIGPTGHHTTDWNKVTCPFCLKKRK